MSISWRTQLSSAIQCKLELSTNCRVQEDPNKSQRGAKTAMAFALKYPSRTQNIVAVDNAPIDAPLLRSFAKYVQGMKKIEQAGVKRLSEADEILQEYEEESIIES